MLKRLSERLTPLLALSDQKQETRRATSYRQAALAVLRSRDFHITAGLFTYSSVVYYLGEIIDLFGLEPLRWGFLYTVHDTHRLIFLYPIVYAGYSLRIRGAMIVTLFSLFVFLPRAYMISPYPYPLLRVVVFTVNFAIVGFLTGLVRNQQEQRIRLEALVRSERDKLLGILERMEDGVFIVGPDYRIRFTNPSMVREFGDGVGSYCYEYLHHFEDPCDSICKLASVTGGAIERWEYTFPDDRTYEMVASPFVDSDGETCQLATFRNITQRKKVEQQLIELDKLKSELLSNVSHELRSPLTSIKGIISSLLQKDIELDSETQEVLLGGVIEETDRLASLITNLLNMSRLEAGVWKPEKERCHIADIVHEALERQRWVNKRHVFETDLEPCLPEVHADYSQIRQVLVNLLENAAAHSEEGARIMVKGRAMDDEVVVSVSDQGVGIPQEDLGRIFDKFYRGSQKRGRPGGTGLGLAICRAIVESHGGEIWAESELGRGSTFHFTLPVEHQAWSRASTDG